MNEASNNKRGIAEPGVQPVGMFAVMRHPPRGLSAARFVSLHDTKSKAATEARRLAGGVIAAHGVDEATCFYVVEVVGRVGIIDGKIEGAV